MFWDLMPIYISTEFAYAKDRNGCNLWEFVATNPGWQSNSYLCSYIVARFNSLLTFFRCKSLHSINCVATRNLTVCWNIFLEESAVLRKNPLYCGRIRCIAPKYDMIFWGSSKVPWQWFIDPTHVGPMNKKKFFFTHHIFSHFLKLNPTDFLYVVRGRDDYYSC